MEINQIIDFVGKRNVAVYGAGILGQALTEILHKYGVSVMRYVVSEEQNIKTHTRMAYQYNRYLCGEKDMIRRMIVCLFPCRSTTEQI